MMEILLVSLIIRLLLAAFRTKTEAVIEIDPAADEATTLVVHPAEYLLRWE